MAIADLLREGMLHHREGRLAEAERIYLDVLRREPMNPQGLHLLGTIEGQRGRLPIALDLLRRAAAGDPQNAHLQNNLGETLRHLGRNPEAIEAFRRAVTLDQTLWAAWTGAAEAAKAEISRAEAAGRGGEARRLRKFASEWLESLGDRYLRQRASPKAEASYREAIALDPKNASACCELGSLLWSRGHLGEAETFLRRAIMLRPDFAEAHNNLGNVLGDRGADEAAEAAFRKALALKPGFKRAADNLANTRLHGLIYRQDVTPERIFAAHRDWGQGVMAELAASGRGAAPTFTNRPDPERPLRVGYLSPDMRAHSVSYFFEPLLANHDPAVIETYCYADVARPDETTRRLRQLARHWRSVTEMSDDAVRAQIAADGIDILVDLAGHTGGNRLTALSPKPAPVTLTWLGYPATTGLPTVDYRITDAEADPPGVSDGLHTERLVRLPQGFLCYRPPANAPPVAPTPALARGYVTFGSFNNPKKITSRCLETWSAILTKLPSARLLLKGNLFADSHVRERVEGGLAKLGIANERIELRTWAAATADHLVSYADVDIGLDPFPYNGTTTTCEAFWMGVPVVTLRGDRHAARVGASLLAQIGLRELIADTVEEHVEKAVGLARDVGRLQSLRGEMRARVLASPLMDERGFARHFETALRDMWRQWCSAAAG